MYVEDLKIDSRIKINRNNKGVTDDNTVVGNTFLLFISNGLTIDH